MMLWVALTEGTYLVARFLVSESFCFLAEVSATAGELEACRHTLGDVAGILPRLHVLAGQKLGIQGVSSER